MMNLPVPTRVLSKLSRNTPSEAIDHDACGWDESVFPALIASDSD